MSKTEPIRQKVDAISSAKTDTYFQLVPNMNLTKTLKAMNYNFDNANRIKVGDTYTDAKGNIHKAIEEIENNGCTQCSVFNENDGCLCYPAVCYSLHKNFYFELQPNETPNP